MENIKLILIGNTQVGKTAIIQQFTEGTFLEEYLPTFAADKKKKAIEIDDETDKIKTTLTLEIWDTLGQENNRAANKIFMKNSKIALLVYDITNQKSFDDLNVFLGQVDEVVGRDNIVLGVVGNKSDLYEDQVITKETGEEYANNIGALFFETTAMENEVIENLFKSISLQYVKKKNLINNNKKDNNDKNDDKIESNDDIGNNKEIKNINEEQVNQIANKINEEYKLEGSFSLNEKKEKEVGSNIKKKSCC